MLNFHLTIIYEVCSRKRTTTGPLLGTNNLRASTVLHQGTLRDDSVSVRSFTGFGVFGQADFLVTLVLLSFEHRQSTEDDTDSNKDAKGEDRAEEQPSQGNGNERDAKSHDKTDDSSQAIDAVAQEWNDIRKDRQRISNDPKGDPHHEEANTSNNPRRVGRILVGFIKHFFAGESA
mmetsp:Transcript_27776/g.58156  ORF Transcript_27776/g.58156 Transcript_27776/m.58156 type:complete len:176 (+) Transcript_27776:1555-2082(+)